MTEQHNQTEQPTPEQQPSRPRAIRMNPFVFVTMIFALVAVTASITFFALTVGEDKVVEVVTPQPIERSEFSKLYGVLDELKKDYLNEMDEEAMLEGAINGMVDALGDPYTDYMSVEETKKFNESISSSFQGIGAEIRESDGYIRIVSPIKNSPAEKTGLLPNDLVMAVDGKSIQGMSSNEAVLLIRGEKGTKVTLTIRRGENAAPFDVEITRDIIPIESVYSEMLEDKIGHIRITSFAETTYDELIEAINDLESQDVQAIVFDVRQNPGGRLDTALKITDLFVESGKPIMQQQQKGKKTEVSVASDGDKINVPFTLLIDEGSASASEILAGAIKEETDGKLIGIKSFGKGTVQTPKQLKDGSMIKMTIANWLTPKGNHIHEKGIEPEIEVPYPKYASLPFIDPSVPVQDGASPTTIQHVQEMLIAIGYDIGEVDGKYGQGVTSAVKAMQKEGQLEETGIVEGETTFLLMQKIREQMAIDDPMIKKSIEVLKEELKK